IRRQSRGRRRPLVGRSKKIACGVPNQISLDVTPVAVVETVKRKRNKNLYGCGSPWQQPAAREEEQTGNAQQGAPKGAPSQFSLSHECSPISKAELTKMHAPVSCGYFGLNSRDRWGIGPRGIVDKVSEF